MNNIADSMWRIQWDLKENKNKIIKKVKLKYKPIKNILLGSYSNCYKKYSKYKLNELKEERGKLKAQIESIKISAGIVAILTAFTTITFSFINSLGDIFNISKLGNACILSKSYCFIYIIIGLLVLLTISFAFSIHKKTLMLVVVEDLLEQRLWDSR